MQYDASDLFHLQSELVEAKVDMAVSRAIQSVLERIDSLQHDMDTRFTSLDKSIDARFNALGQEMIAVKTKLGMSNETQPLIRAKWIEYAFKTGWLFLAAIIAWAMAFAAPHLHTLV